MHRRFQPVGRYVAERLLSGRSGEASLTTQDAVLAKLKQVTFLGRGAMVHGKFGVHYVQERRGGSRSPSVHTRTTTSHNFTPPPPSYNFVCFEPSTTNGKKTTHT